MANASELLELLDLQTQGQGVFVGPPEREQRSRVFGGHVLGQALAAACFTVDGRPCHSLHAYFVRPGKPGRPIQYEVAAMRDGQSFAMRKVMAVQRDELNLELIASFQHDDPGPAQHQPMPETAAPDSFPAEDERIARALERAPKELHARLQRKRAFESIQIEAEPGARVVRRWVRARGSLVDDPNLHRCALAYVSDMGALEPSMRALGASFADNNMQVASLDHAVWFHRPFRCDDWLLFVLDSPSVGGGRGFNRGSVFSRDGQLVASIAQEAVIRPRAAEALQ